MPMQPSPMAETSRFPNLRFFICAPTICSMRAKDRPYVICHMLPSVDGRIVLRDWKIRNATREYERTAATFGADAWIIGRISMEPYAGKARVPKTRDRIAR